MLLSLGDMAGCGMDPKRYRRLESEIVRCCIEMGEQEASELAIHKLEQERIKQTELLSAELHKCRGSDRDKLQITCKIIDTMIGTRQTFECITGRGK